METNYDLQVRERADGQWDIVKPKKRTPIGFAATLEGALERCAEMVPHGYARVRQKTGKVGFVQLIGPVVSRN